MQDPYETSDYQIAVTLHTLGFRLVGLDKSNHKRVAFQFEFDPQISQVVESFFRDELSMNPRLILLSAKLVKDRLHAGA